MKNILTALSLLFLGISVFLNRIFYKDKIKAETKEQELNNIIVNKDIFGDRQNAIQQELTEEKSNYKKPNKEKYIKIFLLILFLNGCATPMVVTNAALPTLYLMPAVDKPPVTFMYDENIDSYCTDYKTIMSLSMTVNAMLATISAYEKQIKLYQDYKNGALK